MYSFPSKVANSGASLAGMHLAAEFDDYVPEMMNAIISMGITLTTYPTDPRTTTDPNMEMIAEALARAASAGVGYQDTGAANAYVLSPLLGSVVPPKALFAGMWAYFVAGHGNTSASTANVAGLGIKPIVTPAGAALIGGEFQANGPTALYWSPSIISGGAWVLPPWANANALRPVVFAGVDSGTANAHVVGEDGDLPVAPALFDGMLLSYSPANANTGAVTVNPFGLGVTPVKTYANAALTGGEFAAGRPTVLRYSNALTAFVLLPWAAAPASVVDYYAVDTSGTANAVVASFSIAPASYAAIAGKLLRIKLANGFTGAATANLNGLGSINIKRPDGSPIQSGDAAAGEIGVFSYDGTNLQLVETLPANVSASGRLLNISLVTSSGAYTPTAGATTLIALAVGGGAAGGGSPANGTGAGGGAGAFIIHKMSLTGVSSVSVTIGAGGAASSGANGGNGGATSFGSYFTAGGGLGGQAAQSTGVNNNGQGGLGGTPTGGTWAFNGNPGDSSGYDHGGNGGPSPLGAAGLGVNVTTTPTTLPGGAALQYGAGGGGCDAGTGPQTGGNGAPGAIMFIELS